jgi:hypothetical protein
MAISLRDLLTVMHGMGFGVLYMMAFSGAIGVIYATAVAGRRWQMPRWDVWMFRFYLSSMATLAWITVLTGTYLIYPWYRAVPPDGTTDLTLYPRRLLLSSPLTSGWHYYGMEWKEHIAWLTPISMTMVAYVFIKYGPQLALHRHMRNAVLGFTVAAFIATGAAGFIGAFLNKFAPVRGGTELVLFRGT